MRDLLLGLLVLQFGLGIVLSGAAGRIRQDAGGSFWSGAALSVLLGMVGFLIVVAGARRG